MNKETRGYSYKFCTFPVDDDTELIIYNDTFVIKTTMNKIKRWFLWHRETDIDLVHTDHLIEYAFHHELLEIFSDPL